MHTQLFLHIGRPKVGSSAIQHFLWANRQILLSRGVLYPTSVMHQSASHKLALVFQPWNPAYRVVTGRSPQDVYSAMFDEAQAAGTKKIVASSENLFIVEPRDVRKQIPKSCETKIVCYVRRQDEVLTSSLLQEIKTGAIGVDTDLNAYVSDPERLEWLDYEKTLDRWGRAFGQENIIVRVYEKEQLQGAIYEDLLNVARVNAAGLTQPEAGVNVSPARDVLDYIVMLNACPEVGGSQKSSLRIPLLRLSERLGKQGSFDGKRMIPVPIRQRILDQFASSNENVARRYLHRDDGILFRNTHVHTEDQDSYDGLDLERFAQMTAALFSAQQKQILSLRKELEALSDQFEKLNSASE